jgi:ribonuclease Z
MGIIFWIGGFSITFTLLNRATDLHIYGPKGLKEIIKLQLRLSNSWTNYLHFHELESNESQVIYEDEKLQ